VKSFFSTEQPSMEADSMAGKTTLITGGNSGIGRATAEEFAGLGSRVVIICRDKSRGETAVEEIKKKTGKTEVHLILCDLGSLTKVKNAVNEFRQRFDALHFLINNAAISSWTATERSETEDGYEKFWATNYLSHYLLTRLLLPDLKKSGSGARIINLGASHSQLADAKIDVKDLQMKKKTGILLGQ